MEATKTNDLNTNLFEPFSMGSLLKDIRFWIALFFILRLYAITDPPLEVGHNWRQTDVLMIARNFYEVDPNPFYPRVDLGGEKTGIVGCEFPLLNYLIYIVSVVFGFQDWYGRLIVLLTSAIGVFYFYRIVRQYFGPSTAFNASIILQVSLWFTYSRKAIPDVFAASLAIVGLYYGLKFLREGGYRYLLQFFVFALAACLSKILAATILTILVLPILDRTFSFNRKIVLSILSVAILGCVCWWYFIWIPYLNNTFGLWGHFSMGYPYLEAAAAFFKNFGAVSKRLYDTPLKFTGLAAFLAGLAFAIKNKNKMILLAFAIPYFSFLLLVLKTGASIIGDEYYILTAIPAMALIAGYGITQIPNNKIAAAALCVIATEGIINKYQDFRVRQPYQALTQLEPLMNKISKPDDLIAINGGFEYPTPMYFAHRRGWSVTNSYLQDENALSGLKQNGCKFIVILKRMENGDVDLNLDKAYDSEYFKVYKVK